MKTMNPDVIGTTYGELVVALTHTLVARQEPIGPAEVVGFAVEIADQLVSQLAYRENVVKELAIATRVILPVDWAPSADDGPSRSGEHWSQPEIDALVAQYKNGLTGAQIAVHHRRSWTAISAQLAKYGLLQATGRGSYERQNGDIWEL